MIQRGSVIHEVSFFMRVNYVRFLAITLENKAYFTLLYFTDMLATEVLVPEILATDFEM